MFFLIFFSQIFTKDKIEQLKIGLCITATNKYLVFVPTLIQSARKHFLKNHQVTFFVFTDSNVINTIDSRIIYLRHAPWPFSTMQRFEAYYNSREILSTMDYIFACDADMLFCDTVSEEILSERVGVIHPYFWEDKIKGKTQYEYNKQSTACMLNRGEHYFAGGFYGGTREEFLKLVKTNSENIRKDLEKNIIAIWHDESHLNKYFYDNPPTLILDPSFCYPEDWRQTQVLKSFPFKKVLAARRKDYYQFR